MGRFLFLNLAFLCFFLDLLGEGERERERCV